MNLLKGGEPSSERRPGVNQWWSREDLRFTEGELLFGGQSLQEISESAEEPCFAYSANRISDNLDRLRCALSGLPSRVMFAMKANRFQPLLTFLKTAGVDGIDVCSPGELLLARQAGFTEQEISFTGTSVSDADLDVIARHREVWVNCDSLSSLRRLGERCKGQGRKVGLRINQRVGIAYDDSDVLDYAGKVTKFGIYREQMEDAFEIASHYGMRITGLHFHAGCGYLNPQMDRFRQVLEQAKPFIEMVDDLEHLNIGGGIGVPIKPKDQPLDLDVWRSIISEVLGESPGYAIWIEPGDYLVKDAGVLLLEVNTVEEKGGRKFVGVNGGFNLHIEPAFYNLPLVIVPCRPNSWAKTETVTVVGNINEALDQFEEEVELPPVMEGDRLAFLNAGGYGSSMSSNHCMRGEFSEYLIF
ncbi:MAG: diaminopimelate decarboxylase [Verrucomicrobiales bacterium]|nr:diaminopimelate decarboxylase [Verrucomicrobiales bacterium]